MMAQHKNIRILLTGNCARECEKALTENFSNLETDILLGAHHGNKTANNTFFLEAVKPKIVVLSSTGPSEEGLQRLQASGAEIYRTDLHGNVKIISDGDTYTVSTEK